MTDHPPSTLTNRQETVAKAQEGNTDKYGTSSCIENQERPPNPYSSASFISKLFFKWPFSVMKIGLKRPITEDDLPSVMPIDSSSCSLKLIDEIWEGEVKLAQKKNRKPSLHRALLKHYLKTIWFVQPLMAIHSAGKIGQSLALGYLIEYFGSGERWQGYFWAGVMVVCGVILLFESHHKFFHTWRMGMRLRAASIASIYSKTLRLSSIGGIATDSASSGQITNLASNDVERFLLSSISISWLFWGPVEALAILLLGLYIIGPAFAAGYALLFVFIPLQYYLSKKFANLRSKVATITDKRVTLVSQAISGARVMKMSGWENQFESRIANIRQDEMNRIQDANRLRGWNEAIFFSANVIVGMVIFLVHVWTGGMLNSRVVFTSLSLINIVQLNMTKFFTMAVMAVSECYVSVKRIQHFLEFPELPQVHNRTPYSTINSNPSQSDNVISLSEVTCCWDINSDSHLREFALNDIALSKVSLQLSKGSLTCIIGPVGCGKSALLQLLAGELPPLSGTINRNHTSLSYASQDPWIMNGTIRENVTMGLPFQSKWYDEIIEACGLNVDISLFQNGDKTLVGDRGVQLSGGQRARIALARAFYRDSEVMLLDDPLSAVDSKVGRGIFYKGIMELVKRGKCVVLATHQHQFLAGVRCVLMEKGSVVCDGGYEECVERSGGALTVALQAGEAEKQEEEKKNEVDDNVKGDDVVDSSDQAPVLHEKKKKADKSNETDDSNAYKEMSNTGVVKLSTWIAYANAMGGVWIGVGLLVLFTVTQASVLVAITFIGKWAEVVPAEDQSSTFYLALITGLGASVIFLSTTRSLSTFYFLIKASQRLHDRMTRSVLRAKIEFFDTNPIGRILNRFSADVGINDDFLPQTLYDFLMTAFLVVGGIVTAITVLPFTLIAVPALLFYFLRLRSIFLTTSRELKRLEGLARSPIYAMISESLNGIATIRSNDAVEYFRKKFEDVHDAHSRAFFMFISSSRWLGFRMDSIMYTLTSVASLLAVLFHDQGWFNVDPAVIGLALTMLLQLAGTFQWCIRQSAEVVNNMVSVERVSAFGGLPSEAALTTERDESVPSEWPDRGFIDVQDLLVRYRSNLPPSLSGVSFQIHGGERVGVVGRTGSGKSTLVQALFRILEAEEGSIAIDDVDIASLGMHKLRTEMSVIPQTPVLFSGCTIRENLDPFRKYDDDAIMSALKDVQMIKSIMELPKGLDSIVAEGGSNFSVGQRQLICLARAILRKSKILVLDEPTANVDAMTDVLLQEAVARSFQDSTIIAVAHRLDTVIDYDRILVLGKGKVLEHGSPRDLLMREEGHFKSMVEDTGEQMAEKLRRRALGKEVENESNELRSE